MRNHPTLTELLAHVEAMQKAIDAQSDAMGYSNAAIDLILETLVALLKSARLHNQEKG